MIQTGQKRSVLLPDTGDRSILINDTQSKFYDINYNPFINVRQRRYDPIQLSHASDIIFREEKRIYIADKLEQLYEKVSKKDMKIYGVPIGKKQNFDNLSKWEKFYLCGCYWVFNQQPVYPSQLVEKLKSIPKDERQIDAIRIEKNQLKLDKLDHSVIYNFEDESLRLSKKSMKLDLYGNLQAKCSLLQLSIGGTVLNFDQPIENVDTFHNNVAIRTKNYVYTLYHGKFKKWDIKNSGIKWGTKGLYILQNTGNIIVLQGQSNFIKNDNALSEVRYCLDKWKPNDFLVAIGDEMILISPTRTQLTFHVLWGFESTVKLNFKQDLNLLYVNGYSRGKDIYIIFLTGQKGKIEQIRQYTFGLF